MITSTLRFAYCSVLIFNWKASTSDRPGGSPRTLISDPLTPWHIRLFQIASLPVSSVESMVQMLYVRDCDSEASCDVIFKIDDELFLAASFEVSFPILKDDVVLRADDELTLAASLVESFPDGNLECSANDEVSFPIWSEDDRVLVGWCKFVDNTKLVDRC